MADPTKFTPSYNFSDYQAQAPANPLPGAQVDIQFQAVKTTTDQAIEAIKDVRRSDGALQNGVVTADSIASSLVIGFTLRGNWVVDTAYMAGDGVIYDEIFYKSRVAHTSSAGTRPDLDSDTWEFLTSMAAISVTDGSITPAKLSSDAAGFRTKVNAASVEQADFAANAHAATAKTSLVDADEFGFWDSVSEGLRKITWANVSAVALADVKWLSKAIGELYAVDDSMAGADVPPTDNAAFRYIKLTASDAYNTGVLTSESVSGSAPLVQATAVINDNDSPLDGETVRLINTERRFLRAGSAGSVQADAMQQITGSLVSAGSRRVFAVGGGVFSVDNSVTEDKPNVPIGSGTTLPGDAIFDSANSPNARTGNETRSKNIGVNYYMRIR